MAIFKCKMCGGDLKVHKGESIGTCSYCGSTMTLPKLDDEKRANLYDRANHYRRNNEFDKAMALYENILNENKTDAEAYWSLVLCKYGIEYVEDPKYHTRVPTCNRTHYTSILMDEDYKKALEYAEPSAQKLYEEEARVIEGIQKGILEISSKEEPFDIFICYKETDNSGRRTQDSVLAQEIYFQLTSEGYKVFFSRITLESVLGTAYEPYIFASLNSAKVMVVVGTKPEHFNSPWVKNEWSRFLGLIKSGTKKTLIPAYKDMDPYDLPKDFSHLQSLDMSTLGFLSDLTRGIKKKLDIQEVNSIKIDNIHVQSSQNANALLKRVELLLEDGDFNKADELLEQVLNVNPELSKAYVGKLMVAFNVNNEVDLKKQNTPLEKNPNYQKAIRFSKSEENANTLRNYNQNTLENYNLSLSFETYNKAINMFNEAKIRQNESLFKLAEELFNSISGFKDSDNLAEICREKAVEAYKKDHYWEEHPDEYKEYLKKSEKLEYEFKKNEYKQKMTLYKIFKTALYTSPLTFLSLLMILVFFDANHSITGSLFGISDPLTISGDRTWKEALIPFLLTVTTFLQLIIFSSLAFKYEINEFLNKKIRRS